MSDISSLQRYIDEIETKNSLTLDDIDKWAKVLSNKDWFNPHAYGELKIETLTDNLHRFYSYLENNLMSLPFLYKELNLSEDQVITNIKEIIGSQDTRLKKDNSIAIRMYQAWLNLEGKEINADAFIRFNDATRAFELSTKPAEFIVSARSFVKTQNDSDSLKTYLIKLMKNELNMNLILEKFKKIFKTSTKSERWAELDGLAKNEYDSKLNKYNCSCMALEFAFPASKHIEIAPVINENKDLPSLIHLMRKGKLPIRASIENYLTTNPELMQDNKTCIGLRDFINESDLPKDTTTLSKKYGLFIKKELGLLAEERKKQDKKQGMANELIMLAIHNSLGLDTSSFEADIIEATKDLPKTVDFNPRSESFNNLSDSIQSAFVYLDYRLNKSLPTLQTLLQKEKVELLRKQKWLGEKVNEDKDKINADDLALYLSAIDKSDPNWPPVFGKVLRHIQLNTSRSRKYIKLIKDTGGPAQDSVSRDFDEVSAFVYAMTGDDSKNLRKAADLMDINIFKEEYCGLVVEHVKKLLNPNSDKELKLPSLEFEV